MKQSVEMEHATVGKVDITVHVMQVLLTMATRSLAALVNTLTCFYPPYHKWCLYKKNTEQNIFEKDNKLLFVALF